MIWSRAAPRRRCRMFPARRARRPPDARPQTAQAVVFQAEITPPSVTSFTAATGSCSVASTVGRADVWQRQAGGTTSTAIIVVAPTARAAITALKPTAPGRTPRSSSRPDFQRVHQAPAPVWMPQPSRPSSASGASFGTFTTLRSSQAPTCKTTTGRRVAVHRPWSSLWVPVPSARPPLKLCALKFTQLAGRPCSQRRQRPQDMNVSTT